MVGGYTGPEIAGGVDGVQAIGVALDKRACEDGCAEWDSG